MHLISIALSVATLGASVLAAAGSSFKVRQVGAFHTKDLLLYLENEDGVPMSFFHDVPLYPDPKNTSVVNMVVEIPRWHNAKLEIDRETPLNPIHQDTKNDVLRYIANIFPHKGYPGNYGSIPQTWEDIYYKTPETGTTGDNDPVDIIEIGQEIGFPGQIKQVKFLGGLLMLDDNQTDWKLIALDINDKWAPHVNDISDLDQVAPGYLEEIRDWYKIYKVPQSGQLNTFGFNGEFKDHRYVHDVIVMAHDHWTALINGTTPRDKKECTNLSNDNSPYKVNASSDVVKNVPKEKILPDAPINATVNEFSFLASQYQQQR
ncbi:hypothetical protein VTP01DRAFT_2852 [Rhizomucor pusillus]|uniref:uncharacterized protein n=1 Tax=Rhizomucor pusillus TaxID=4840 RepID=UPI00374374FC